MKLTTSNLKNCVEVYRKMYSFDAIELTDKVHEINKETFEHGLTRTNYDKDQIAKAIVGYLVEEYIC